MTSSRKHCSQAVLFDTNQQWPRRPRRILLRPDEDEDHYYGLLLLLLLLLSLPHSLQAHKIFSFLSSYQKIRRAIVHLILTALICPDALFSKETLNWNSKLEFVWLTSLSECQGDCMAIAGDVASSSSVVINCHMMRYLSTHNWHIQAFFIHTPLVLRLRPPQTRAAWPVFDILWYGWWWWW